MAIHFYRFREKYGSFSNFSRHSFELDSLQWPTVEHYFQAQKFPNTGLAERIRLASTPLEAKKLGRTRSIPLRVDWEEVKDDVMRRAIRRKFEVYPKLRNLLLSTGDEELVEDSPSDYYWGCGADGSGKNMTGVLLMEVRSALRAFEAAQPSE
jgi:ribA/ribD-fused uncharacterized protein